MKTTVARAGLVLAALTCAGVRPAQAAPPLTTIQDQMFRADGTPVSGTLIISWKGFVASDNSNIPTNSIRVPVSGGTLRVRLTPTTTAQTLTFRLAREEFAIQVLRVREIMGLQDITAVPQTPHYMKGVINLRGKIVPVVDLRAKFGFPEVEATPATCIIVVQLQSSRDTVLMGLLVDAASEVLNFVPGDIENTPDFGQGVSTPYLLGIAKMKGAVKMLLNIDEVLSSSEVKTVWSPSFNRCTL